MADQDDAVEETVMLTRRGRRSHRADAEAPVDSSAAEAAAEPAADEDIDDIDDVDERTVAVDRRRPAEEERPRTPLEEHADESAEEPIEDHTVVVDRAVQQPALVSHPAALDDADDLDATIPAAPARRVEAEPLPAIYKPRPTPLAPSRPPVVAGGIAPSRVIDEQAVSVSRAARRLSGWVLAAVAGACVVSVCGLVALVFAVFL